MIRKWLSQAGTRQRPAISRANLIQRLYHLIAYSALANIKAEISRLHLGLAWWVIEPLMYMAVFYLVFGVIFERGGPDYPAFLLTGLVVYRWFDTSVRTAMNAIVTNGNLIQQVYVPKYVFPVTAVLATTIKFLFVFPLLVILLVILGHHPSPSWVALPAVMAIELIFAVVIGTIAALTVPFLPDIRILINNGLILLLFLSGIFYSVSNIPEPWQTYFFLNPMAVIIQAFRDILLEARWPDWSALSIIFLGSLFALGMTLKVHNRLDLIYAKRVS